MLSVRWWQDRLYPSPESRDTVRRFVQEVYGYVSASSIVLDVGAGKGKNNTYSLKGNCQEIVGIDLEPGVRENPLLDRGVVGSALEMPFPDETFDVIFCIYVLEHIADPPSLVGELRRLLKPGGVLLTLTPNLWHYVSLIGLLTPTWFHKWYNAKRGGDEDDTFPTYYRMNTLAGLRRLFSESGFKTLSIGAIEGQPNYLCLFLPAFLLGAIYERIVNSCSVFECLRVNIIGIFQKPS